MHFEMLFKNGFPENGPEKLLFNFKLQFFFDHDFEDQASKVL